jgi:proteic killer suppression protein
MELRFDDADLARLEFDAQYSAGKPPDIVRAFRKKLNFMRQAQDENDLRAFRSLRLTGTDHQKENQYFVPLNDRSRLVIEFEPSIPVKRLVIVAVEEDGR